METITFKNNLTEATKIFKYIIEQDKVCFEEIYKFSNDFMKIYTNEKKKLPYHLNILDLIWANENSHSRIFAELLKQKHGEQFEILELFCQYLQQQKQTFNFEIIKPKITVEKDRIDVLIMDDNFSLIIENKIHNAIDQLSQIARYIDTVKANRNKKYGNKKDEIDSIFVLYLTSDNRKTISEQSWGNYKEVFKDHFLHITFEDDILPFLKEFVLPNCRLKDAYLRSAIEQYTDHLEGLFDKREINKNMNDNLKEYIKDVLKLTGPLEENIKIIEKKETEFNKVSDHLRDLKNELNNQHIEKCSEQYFKDWENKLLTKYYNYQMVYEKSKKIGVKIKYLEETFDILIEIEKKENPNYIYYCIYKEDFSETSNDLAEILNHCSEGMRKYYPWYGWEKTSFEDAYLALTTLIKKVEEQLNKVKKD